MLHDIKYIAFVLSLRLMCFGRAFYVVLTLNITPRATSLALTLSTVFITLLHPLPFVTFIRHVCFTVLPLEGGSFVRNGGAVQ
jgi:hypothetical protein